MSKDNVVRFDTRENRQLLKIAEVVTTGGDPQKELKSYREMQARLSKERKR